ncbi:MAG: acetyl-CoA carboxylase biotin carboxyl carrier protein [Fibrobacterota bacterium]|mgnify:CR=1 FL=1
MNVDEIAKLIELLDKSSLSELQWNAEGERLLLKKPGPAVVQVASAPVAMAAPAPVVAAASAPVAAPAAVSAPAAPTQEAGLVEIKSPMVGTFYRSASPDSPSYVEEGGRVEKGKPVCIVEAMKLMNEIEADVTGTVVKVCVQNEQPVEYGTVLFLVRPA